MITGHRMSAGVTTGRFSAAKRTAVATFGFIEGEALEYLGSRPSFLVCPERAKASVEVEGASDAHQRPHLASSPLPETHRLSLVALSGSCMFGKCPSSEAMGALGRRP